MKKLPLILTAFALVLAVPGHADATTKKKVPKTRAVCATAKRSHLRCRSYVRLDSHAHPARTTRPAGYGPAQLRSAYGIPAPTSAGLVAIVTAYDDPQAEGDLAVWRSTFGLAPCRAGCLTIVGQDGSPHRPDPNTGWAEETSLDLAMVSTGCPTCSIELVEASSSSLHDLAAAERTATALPGVLSVTNSFGAPEAKGDQAVASAFAARSAGTWVVASSGDDGYGVEFPASVPGVVAVGGTTLQLDASGSRVSEVAWSGSGSGCSKYGAAPAWQPVGPCGDKRAVSDVAADADPATGVSVYDSYGRSAGSGGWLVVGGTSASAPFVAGLHAAAASGSSSPASLYAGGLLDITSGASGRCRPAGKCTAGPGWDGPTGVGVPVGLAGF